MQSKSISRSAANDRARELKLESALPLARVARRLSEGEEEEKQKERKSSSSWTVTTTDDAGRYLCNFIYWHSLRACACCEGEEEASFLFIIRLDQLL